MYYGICYYFFEPDLRHSLWLKFNILVNIVVQMEIRFFVLFQPWARFGKKKIPNVIIPKNHRFSQCTTCAQLKSDLKAKTNFMSSNFSDQKIGNNRNRVIIIFMTHIFVILVTEKKNSECKASYGGT